MNISNRLAYIAMVSVPSIGPKTVLHIDKWLRRHKLPWSFLWHDKKWPYSCALSSLQIERFLDFQKRFTPESYHDYLQAKKIETVVWWESDYPSLLKQTPDRPLVLFVQGKKEKLHEYAAKSIGVVGTRHSTGYGGQVTRLIVRELIEGGTTVTSGFMYGIDHLVHRSALDFHGPSIAVLGFGFDWMYPKNYRGFHEEFLAAGNLSVTEYPPDTQPTKGTFRQRNRIIAGLSLAVAVIEAGEKSGSLITAEKAGEYGREVCAVPGPITSIYSQGTKELINQGATLITSGWDIIEQLGGSYFSLSKIPKTSFEEYKDQDTARQQQTIEQEILDQLMQPLSLSEIAARLSLPIEYVTAQVTLLELHGLAEKQGTVWLRKEENLSLEKPRFSSRKSSKEVRVASDR